MLNNTPIIEIDVHGMQTGAALARIEDCIRTAPKGVYRIRVIHGFNRGNQIQQAIYREFDRGLEPAVKRIAGGSNPGITELILREF